MKHFIPLPGQAAAPTLVAAPGRKPSTPTPAPLTVKSIAQLQLPRTLRFRGTFFAMFATCLAAGFSLTHAATPSVQPLLQGKWPAWPQGGSASDVKVVGDYAYVALGEAGVAVIDVSNPTDCVRVGGYDTIGLAKGVAVSGNYAYVADYTNGLQVIDVSNPTRCVRVGGYDTSGAAHSVVVSGNYAYVADEWRGLQVIDVSNPSMPMRVGGSDTYGSVFGVAVSGNYAYVMENQVEDCDEWENFCWIVKPGGLRVIDVSTPTNCVLVCGCDTSGYALSVAVSGNYAYVADYGGGLQVIDVRNPTNCVLVGGYDTSGAAHGVVVSGNHAYVADGSSGLQVIDVSDPAHCVRVGGYDLGRSAVGVAVVADRIYVVDYIQGLLVLPSLPNVQFAVRVDATPNVPFTIETATDLSALSPWTPLLTTNVPAMPFDYVDFDVKLSDQPQKFYRVRQP